MAFLDRAHLTCPGCGKTGDAVFVVGIGPNTKPGEGPAYVSLHDAGPWVAQAASAQSDAAVRLFCPDCGAEVLNRSANRKA